MKPKTSVIDWTKRVATLVTTTAIVIAPFVTTPVQADPPDHAPAHGWRKDKKDKKDKKNKNRVRNNRNNRRDDGDDDDRDDDDGDGRRNDRNDDRVRSLSGVVTRDLSGDRFEIRTDNGRVVRVNLRQEVEPGRLTRGDRVRVNGRFENGVFFADDLDILDNRDNGGGSNGGGVGGTRVDFSATVINRNSSNRFTVRGDNGRNYVVVTRDSVSGIDDGDRVRVVGTARNATIAADTLTLIRNGDTGGVGRPGANITFNGVVRKVDARARNLSVRADDGRTFLVKTLNAGSFSEGDRVSVSGKRFPSFVMASSVSRR